MAITYVGGTGANATGVATQTYPAGYAAGMVALLFVEHRETDSPSAPTGYTALSVSPVVSTDTQLAAYYRVLDGGESSTFTVPDAGDHNATTLHLFDGCDTSTPIHAESSTVGSNTTSVSADGVTTSVNDCAIVVAVGTSRDSAITNATFSAWTNANLTTIDEIADRTMSGNAGGGYGVAWGILATAGASGSTTATQATGDYWTAITVALKPASAGGGVTGTLAGAESGADTASLSGLVLVDGSLSASESGTDTASIAGSVPVSGELAAGESGSDTASFVGDGASPAVTGALSASESGTDSATVSGKVYVAGMLSATEGGLDGFAASGDIIVQGALAASEAGADTASFTQDSMTLTQADIDAIAAAVWASSEALSAHAKLDEILTRVQC